MNRLAVLAGSFDPIHLGHLDILRRGASLFDEVLLACGNNPAKRYRFDLETRLELLRAVTADLPNVRVDAFEGLSIHYCQKVGAAFILRGLRGPKDFEFESQIGQANRHMSPGLDTVFLLSAPDQVFLSSSLIKEIHDGGGDVSPYVPAEVLAALRGASG